MEGFNFRRNYIIVCVCLGVCISGVYVCVYVYASVCVCVVCMYKCFIDHTWLKQEPEGGARGPSLSLCLVTLRPGLLLNLEVMLFHLGWQPASPGSLPISAPLTEGVTGVWGTIQHVCWNPDSCLHTRAGNTLKSVLKLITVVYFVWLGMFLLIVLSFKIFLVAFALIDRLTGAI